METSKLHVTGLCAGNSPVTGEFPAQKASNAENATIWWRHHDNSTRLYDILYNDVGCMIHHSVLRRAYVLDKYVIIGSDNGLSPLRRQATI